MSVMGFPSRETKGDFSSVLSGREKENNCSNGEIQEGGTKRERAYRD